MDSLTQDVVREFLKGHGLTRSLRAFEASLLASASGAPGAVTKKASKLEAPALASTDDSIPRLDRMVREHVTVSISRFL